MSEPDAAGQPAGPGTPRPGADLRVSPEHLAAIVDSMGDAVVATDLDGIVTSWNAGARRLFGYEAAETIGRSVAELTPEDRHHELTQTLREAREGRVVGPYETIRRTKSGAPVDVSIIVSPVRDGHGTVVGAARVARDISALKARERELERMTRFAESMIESLPGVLYFYDVSGRFLRWNRRFRELTGYADDDIAGMHPLQFIAEDDVRRVEGAIDEVFALGESSVEAGLRHRDGRVTPYFFTGRRVELEGTPCLVGVGIDITARVRLEAERERRFQAETADRVKSAFLATMSHELRTPLNSIIGFTGILLKGLAGPLNPEQHKQLGMVRTSAQHLLALVNDVLDISRIEAGQLDLAREVFDIQASLMRVIALVEPQATARGLDLRLVVDGALGEALSDRRRFEQILLNLLSNGVKFTEQGSIELRASLVQDASWLRCAVTDTGIGIAREHLDTLFQPFRQIQSGLARQHEGTGLGLAICRRLAGLMGGHMDVASTPGLGSTFVVTLPLQAPVP